MRHLTIAFVLLACLECLHITLNHSFKVQASIQTTPLPKERIAQLLNAHDVPGMSYAKLQNCEVVETGEAGYGNVEDTVKVDSSTIFEAASLSKPVFSWLVMSLVEEGIVDLDETFAAAGFEYARISDGQRYSQLTPRLVLMHRTGLPNWTGDPRVAGRETTIPFEHDPATVDTYSGEAYFLLQRFIEDKTEQQL